MTVASGNNNAPEWYKRGNAFAPAELNRFPTGSYRSAFKLAVDPSSSADARRNSSVDRISLALVSLCHMPSNLEYSQTVWGQSAMGRPGRGQTCRPCHETPPSAPAWNSHNPRVPLARPPPLPRPRSGRKVCTTTQTRDNGSVGLIHDGKHAKAARVNATGRQMTSSTPPMTIFLIFIAVLESRGVTSVLADLSKPDFPLWSRKPHRTTPILPTPRSPTILLRKRPLNIW